ncbi:hypothetical protein AB4142_30895, partial [Variovorax sp. 2RAF20]
STLDGAPAARPFDVGMQPGEHLGDPRRYAEVVNQALRENPPPAAEAALVAGFAQSGIGADCVARGGPHDGRRQVGEGGEPDQGVGVQVGEV